MNKIDFDKWSEEKTKEVVKYGSDFLKSIFETTTDNVFLYTAFGSCHDVPEMEKAAIEIHFSGYTDKAQEMLKEAHGLNGIVPYMDDEIRESLHSILAPCDDVLFLIAYMGWHNIKYNEDFTI